MSAWLLINREDEKIDNYRPKTLSTSPVVTQSDDPGEDLQRIGEPSLRGLPAASVGGQNASGIQNGFSTGFRSLFTRQQPFSGAVAKPPAITNPVQGDVGQTNRAGRLYAGVMNQLVQYNPSQNAYAASYVGAMPLETEAK